MSWKCHKREPPPRIFLDGEAVVEVGSRRNWAQGSGSKGRNTPCRRGPFSNNPLPCSTQCGQHWGLSSPLTKGKARQLTISHAKGITTHIARTRYWRTPD
jgi:hypothetical protein